MKDTWSWLNEIVQNAIALGVVGTYLILVLGGTEAPVELKAFVGAILLFFGFRIYKQDGKDE
uniref:Holin n=1 Tax=viral metagenome TaxID=1070528 RepID=A0A6M3JAY1_9ZZZZ